MNTERPTIEQLEKRIALYTPGPLLGGVENPLTQTHVTGYQATSGNLPVHGGTLPASVPDRRLLRQLSSPDSNLKRAIDDHDNLTDPLYQTPFDNSLRSYFETRRLAFHFGFNQVNSMLLMLKANTGSYAASIKNAYSFSNQVIGTEVQGRWNHTFPKGILNKPVKIQDPTGTDAHYIDWVRPRKIVQRPQGANDANIASELNRLLILPQLALAYRLQLQQISVNGVTARPASEYLAEIPKILYSWAYQNPVPDDLPTGAGSEFKDVERWNSDESHTYPDWSVLNAGIRAEALLQTYHLLIGTEAFTGNAAGAALHTNFIIHLFNHANFLGRMTDAGGINVKDNKGLKGITTLMTLVHFFGNDVTLTGAWRTLADGPNGKFAQTDNANYRRDLTKQFDVLSAGDHYGSYKNFVTSKGSDGMQIEQSVNYASTVVRAILDQYLLQDTIRRANPVGTPRPFDQALIDRNGALPLVTRLNAIFQLATPDGYMVEVGDTPRASLRGLFTTARLTLKDSAYLTAQDKGIATAWPTQNNVGSLLELVKLWGVGSATLTGSNDSAFNRSTGSSLQHISYLPRSGYFMLRGTNTDTDNVQMTFKAGPMGMKSVTSDGHAQYDQLSIDLTGFKRPLIEDPGIYSYNPTDKRRAWTQSTPAHNTINVNGYSHARSNLFFGYWAPGRKKMSGSSTEYFGESVTGWHYGYTNIYNEDQNLDDFAADKRVGRGPAVGRTIWTSGGSPNQDAGAQTYLVIDWAQQAAKATGFFPAHTKPLDFQQSFLIPLQQAETPEYGQLAGEFLPISGDTANGGRYSTGAGGNVLIKSIQPISGSGLGSNKVAVDPKTNTTFDSNSHPFVASRKTEDGSERAARYTITQNGKRANFVTLIYASKDGSITSKAPTITILAQDERSVRVAVTYPGATAKKITFENPFFAPGGALMPREAIAPAQVTQPRRYLNPLTIDPGIGYPSFFTPPDDGKIRDSTDIFLPVDEGDADELKVD